MAMLFHIVSRADWHAGLAQGEYRAASLLSEGFVHCSFAEQVAGVANALYRNAEGCCVVEIDPTRLFTRIAVEDSYGSGTAYPHVYGPIPVAAAVAVHELIRDADGDYLFSVCDAAGSASPDR